MVNMLVIIIVDIYTTIMVFVGSIIDGAMVTTMAIICMDRGISNNPVVIGALHVVYVIMDMVTFIVEGEDESVEMVIVMENHVKSVIEPAVIVNVRVISVDAFYIWDGVVEIIFLEIEVLDGDNTATFMEIITAHVIVDVILMVIDVIGVGYVVLVVKMVIFMTVMKKHLMNIVTLGMVVIHGTTVT